MSDHRTLLALAEIYVLDTLDPEDRELLESHLRAGCEECEAVIEAAGRVADQLVHAVPAVDPSPQLRVQLLARVEADLEESAETPKTNEPARSLRFARYALAASLILAAGLGAWVTFLTGVIGDEREARTSLEQALVRESGAKDSALARLADSVSARDRVSVELTALQEKVGHLTAAQTRTVAMLGQGELSGASARAYLDPENRRLVLFVYDLPAVPAGKSYQLWVIAGNQPVSAGVFEPGATGRDGFDTVSQLPLDGAVTIAVTIEPEGGVPQPTGPIVLAGT